MRCLACVLLVACSGGGTAGTGTVVYSHSITGALHLKDLDTGEQRQLAGGPTGAVAITGDGEYVAFSRGDRIVRVSDRIGTITELPLGGKGCAPTPVWGPNHSLSWCISEAGGSYTGFLPTIGATPRRLSAHRVVASADGSQIAYLALAQPGGPSPRGDLVVENADGSNRRVLRADVDAMVIDFLPDGQLLVQDHPTDFTYAIQRIDLASGSTTDLGPGGVNGLATPWYQVSYSPDRSEVLTGSNHELLALNIATGARRSLAQVPADGTIGSAAFIDRDRVVFTVHRDMSVSDIGMFRESIQLGDPGGQITLVEEATTNSSCRVIAIARAAGYVASTCGGATLATLDGQILTKVQTPFDPLGLSADEGGVVVVLMDGTVSYLSRHGELIELARAVSVFEQSPGADTGLQPFAAYAP
ncbi:MAG: hypothetical protein H0T46_10315 [Deltaproteobacteria bacterium]|nr:hypothetical protein [Deltaproteobacteria bacterium]